MAVKALGSNGANGTPRTLPASQLEVAVLDRTRANRKFKRLTGAALTDVLPVQEGAAAEAAPADTPPHDADNTDNTADSDASAGDSVSD